MDEPSAFGGANTRGRGYPPTICRDERISIGGAAGKGHKQQFAIINLGVPCGHPNLSLRGLASGTHTDGAVFVFDLLEDGAKDSAVVEGPRKLIGVMYRWGFEGFADDSRDQRLARDGGKSCFACHEQWKGKTFVFTEARK